MKDGADFDLRVDESTRTGDGDSLFFRYYTHSKRWEKGD
jgi:hypothetical protein